VHVLFVEPHFPRNQREFVRALSSVGARVTGIGESPAGGLDGQLKGWLHGYEQVSSVTNEAALLEQQKQEQAHGATGAPSGTQSAAHDGPTGKMGTPDTTTTGMTAIAGNKPTDRPGPSNVRQWVSGKGVLGVMQSTDMSALFGGDEEWGSKKKYAYGGDLDATAGNGHGSFGMATQGVDRGGCPPGTKYCNGDSIGSGDYPTIGGPGPRDGFTGTGPGSRLRPRGKTDHLPPTMGPPVVGPDGLDKAIVRRYIRNRLEAIGYCYEKQLTVNGTLGGTITVDFVIGKNGAVISARAEGGVGSPAVDACVKAQVLGIQFPASESLTNVRYPFTFHTAGQ